MAEGRASRAAMCAEAYALLAAAYLPPTPPRRKAIADASRAMFANGGRDQPWSPLLREYVERLGWAGPAAEPVHVRLMEVAADGARCLPLAGAHTGDPSHAWEPVPAVEGLAARLGVRARREIGGRADHLSVELEMLAILSRVEALAEEEERAEDAARARREAERFLRGHVLAWFPRFQACIRSHDTLGVATAAVDATAAFLTAHLADLQEGSAMPGKGPRSREAEREDPWKQAELTAEDSAYKPGARRPSRS